jgi:hypothetical protein
LTAILPCPNAPGALPFHRLEKANSYEFYSPTAYSDAEWRLWVIKMTKKARLKPDQQELLIRYGRSVQP